MKRFIGVLFCLLIAAALAGCYTSFHGPAAHMDARADEDRAMVEEYDDGPIDLYMNPSVPRAMMDNYSWNYYYQSAWWRDSYDIGPGAGAAADGRAPEPRDFRVRYPNSEPNGPGGYAAPGGASVAAPGLSKKTPDPGTNEAGSRNQDPRRDFDKRSQTQKEDSDRTQPKREKKQ